jgi:hypothetical protein
MSKPRVIATEISSPDIQFPKKLQASNFKKDPSSLRSRWVEEEQKNSSRRPP